MKLHKILIPAAAVLCLTLLLSACKAKPPVPGSADPTAEEYSVASKAITDLRTALSEMSRLGNPEGVVRDVRSSAGFAEALADEKNTQLRLADAAIGEVRIEAGDYTDRSFYFDAPEAGVVCDADLGSVTLTSLNADGMTLNGTAKTVYINGAEINLTLNNSVERLYITARDANVTLTNGSFPVVYCDNTSDVITNKTEETVLLILPNGATTEIPAGKTYFMDTGNLKNAK